MQNEIEMKPGKRLTLKGANESVVKLRCSRCGIRSRASKCSKQRWSEQIGRDSERRTSSHERGGKGCSYRIKLDSRRES